MVFADVLGAFPYRSTAPGAPNEKNKTTVPPPWRLPRIAALDEAGRQQMAQNGKNLVFEGHDKARVRRQGRLVRRESAGNPTAEVTGNGCFLGGERAGWLVGSLFMGMKTKDKTHMLFERLKLGVN